MNLSTKTRSVSWVILTVREVELSKKGLITIKERIMKIIFQH